MKKLLLIMAVMSLSQCAPAQGAFDLMLKGLYKATVPLISVDSAQQAKDMSKALFLDTRSSEEYAVSHIEAARFIDYDAFDIGQLEDIPRDSAIVVYCSVGYRSERIGEQLIDAGFTNVRNLYGGIFEWKNTRQQVVNSNEQPTDSVHAYNKLWGIWLKEGIRVYDR